MPGDRGFKVLNLLHGFVLRATRGRIGWTAPLGRMPVVELTTIGRRSGERRKVLLTVPVRDGDAIVLVASRFGDDRHPAWFLNVQANADVEVEDREGKRPMRARIPTGADRAALWQRVVTDHSNYADYQAKTDREIPLVVLEPPS